MSVSGPYAADRGEAVFIAEPELPYLETIALKSTRPQGATTLHSCKKGTVILVPL
jgi:hypothetical protein